MRIVVATSANLLFRPQAECMAEVMRSRGHEVSVVTHASLNAFQGYRCDLLFCIGTGESLKAFLDAIPATTRILYMIESLPTPVEVDYVTAYKLRVHQDYIHSFGCVFVHTQRSVPIIQGLGVARVETLVWPHFPAIYRPAPNVSKDIDVLFIGSTSTGSAHRQRILQHAARTCRVMAGEGIYHRDTAILYSRAKIVLNIHFTPLRAFEARVTEVLGCGSCLFTEALDPSDLFLDKVHLVVFDEENLPGLIDRYLKDSRERERIAQAGYAEIQKYSVERQAARILQAGMELQSLGPPPVEEFPTTAPRTGHPSASLTAPQRMVE